MKSESCSILKLFQHHGWMDGWVDLLVGTGVNTALENVQWPKPFLTPAKPLFDYAMILK